MREYLCVAWWAMVLQHGLTQTVEEVHFSRDETCPDQVVSASHCRLAVKGRSTVHCAVLCSGQPWCVYSVWDSNLRLCRLCQVAEDAGCTNTERVALAGYRRVTMCENGGTWDPATQQCSCDTGFAGNTCQRLIQDCSEGYNLGYPDDVYNIQPALAAASFSALCQMKYGGRTFIVVHSTPEFLFNRTWQEYRDGFGDVGAADHWLGLQSVYLLTNSGPSFILKVEIRQDSSTYFQQYYRDFKIMDEANYYQLFFGSTTSNTQRPLGDSLSPALNSSFSTYDADHDGDVTENCALRHQSGWWFPTSCGLTTGNPLGRLERLPDGLRSNNPDGGILVK